MTVYTKQITVVADEPTRVASIDPHPWRALEFDFGIGQVVWVVSHEDSIPYLPAGSSVLSSRMLEPFDYNRACGYLSGSSTYTSPEYEIVDKDNSFSEFLADKNLNLVSSLNKVVREYEWDRNTDLPVWAGTNGHRILSKGTWLFKNHESLGYATKVKVTCADIYRSMDKKIFEPLQWTVGASFGVGDTQIVTTIDVDDFTANPDTYWRPFEHGAHYHHQPSQTGTFIRLESTGSDTVRKEIVWASDMRVSGGNVIIDVVRAQFLTTAQAVTIDASATAENGKRLNEWIYIDETVTTLFEFLIEGVSGSRTFPTHWTAGAVGFANQYATGFHASEFRLQFSNPKAQTVKKFLESEILIPSVAVSPVNGRGQLTFNPIVLPTDDNAGELVFDESNCKTNRNISLRHVKDDIHTAVEFKYDYDANDNISDDKFQSVAQYNSVDSESFHGFSKTKSYEFQGLHSGLHTNEQLRKLAGAIGDKFYFERLETSIESSINDVALGSLVRVKFNTNIVIDDSTGVVGPLDRTMTVIEARENRARRTTTYQLVGTLQLAQDFYAGQRTHNIEPEEYMRDGIDLAPMIAAGAITLEMGQKYYYYDPLNAGVGVVIGPSVSVTVTGFGPPPQIWCFGFLDWTPDIDLTARSVNQGGMGATTTTEPTQGEYGFFGGQISSGGFTAKRLYTSFTDSSSPGSGSAGTVGDSANQNLVFTASNRFSIEQTGPTFQRVGNTAFPPIVLNANNGQLGGLPYDLSGAGGAGSPLVNLVDRNEDTSGPIDLATLEGSDGGIGGGSLIIVCHGMIMRGRITTNGGDAELPDSLGFSTQSFNGSRGGGGDAGGLLVVVDGAHTKPLFDENNFHAFAGDNQIAGRAPSNYFTINAAVPVGPQTNLAPTNQWESRLKILYTPETAVVQQLATGTISAFLQNQRDNRVRVFIQDVDPSNADEGDARITLTDLNSGSDTPPFRVFDPDSADADANGWRPFDYNVDSEKALYLAMFANLRDAGGDELISSFTRPVGEDGNQWHDINTGNIVRLLEGGPPDELIFAGETQVGTNKYRDGNLARMAVGEVTWVYTDDLDELPTFPIETISGVIVTGGGTIYSLSPVTGLQVFVYSDSQVELVYNTPASAASEGITGYNIYQDGVLITTVTGGSHLINGLTASTSYTFGVESTNSSGGVSATVSSSATTQAGGGGGATLDPVTNLTSAVYSSSSIELFWNTPTDVSNITGFEVRRDGVLIGTTGNVSGSFFDTGLTAATTFVYTVRSVNGAGDQSVDVSETLTTNP